MWPWEHCGEAVKGAIYLAAERVSCWQSEAASARLEVLEASLGLVTGLQNTLMWSGSCLNLELSGLTLPSILGATVLS